MKRILLSIILLVTSMHSASAGIINCDSVDNKISKYPVYKNKIDTIFQNIFSKDESAQEKFHAKIKTVTEQYLLKTQDGSKLHTIIGYLYCENGFHLGQEWEEITHDNTWNNPQVFKNGDYFFPDFKFSVPKDWERHLGGDRDDGSMQTFHQEMNHDESVGVFTYSPIHCEKAYSMCGESNIYNIKEQFGKILNFYKENKSTVFSINKNYKLFNGENIHTSLDGKISIFIINNTIVSITFPSNKESLKNRVLSSIQLDSTQSTVDQESTFHVKHNSLYQKNSPTPLFGDYFNRSCTNNPEGYTRQVQKIIGTNSKYLIFNVTHVPCAPAGVADLTYFFDRQKNKLYKLDIGKLGEHYDNKDLFVYKGFSKNNLDLDIHNGSIYQVSSILGSDDYNLFECTDCRDYSFYKSISLSDIELKKYLLSVELNTSISPNNLIIVKDFGNSLIWKKDKIKHYLYHGNKLIDSHTSINFPTFSYRLSQTDFTSSNIAGVYKSLHDGPGSGIILIDWNTQDSINLGYGSIVKISSGISGTYVLLTGENGWSDLRLITKDGIHNSFVENKQIFGGIPDAGDETIGITDFELMSNKRIKVYYTKGHEAKKEIVIDLSSLIK